MNAPAPQLDFAVDGVWQALAELLSAQLGHEVDVDTISAKDFDEEGELTIRPPAARVYFAGEKAKPFESQARNYSVDQDFGVICAAEDLSADPQIQRLKSAALARRVKSIVVGARLLLETGETSEPVEYVGMEPIKTESIGTAYVAGFRICGIAQFPAPNAIPQPPQGGQ